MMRSLTLMTLVMAVAGPAAAQSYECKAPFGSNCKAYIPDFKSQLTSTLLVSTDECAGETQIKDVNVRLQLLHQNVGDLIATLTSPEGKSVQFLIRPGVTEEDYVGCTGDDIDATFSDQAPGSPTSCPTATPALTGLVRSTGQFSALNGTSRFGTWTLKLEDRRPLGKGVLLGWTLELPCDMPLLSVVASDPEADSSGDTGTVTFKRSGDTTAALDVYYSVGGTAAAEAFTALPGMITIPAGEASADLTVTPVAGELAEPVTVVVTATGGEWLSRGAKSAKVTISPPPAAPAGPSTTTTTPAKSGCGCQSSGVPTELALTVAIVALWLRRKTTPARKAS